MRVVDHNAIDVSKWDVYVEKHRYGTIFHTPEYYHVLAETPGHRPFALFCVDDSGRITGLLLAYYSDVLSGALSSITRRIVLMNAPIVDDTKSMHNLLNSLKRKTKWNAIYLEIRNHYDLGSFQKVYSQAGYVYDQHLNILVDLAKSEDDLWKDVSASRRREIRKAVKEGFNFCVEDKNGEDKLYPILQEIYGRAKLPLVSKGYFESVYKMPRDKFAVLCLYLENEVVGALLVLMNKNTVYGLYGGSKEAYFKQRPNDLLFWSALLWAKSNGYTVFDWLGAGHPDKPYGVREWKKQFGGEFVNYGRYYYYPNKLLFGMAERIFRLYRQCLKDKK